MADDKRAEAMRRAIAESDAQRGGGSDSGGKKPKRPAFLDKLATNDKVAGAADVAGKQAGELKKKAGSLWSSKMGKIGIIAVVGVVALFIVVNIATSIMGAARDVPVSYQLSDAILCVYEDDSVTSGYAYDAYVELTNTGSTNIYAKDVSFMIQDDQGNRIMIDGNINIFPAIIRPGEKGYLFNRFGTELTGVYDPGMTLYLSPTYTVMRSEAEPHTYPVENITVSDGSLGQKMSGQVTNDTAQMADAIYVIGVTYNESGHCTGISGTFLRNVEPHVSVNVQFDPMNMVRAWRTEQVVNYTVYAY